MSIKNQKDIKPRPILDIGRMTVSFRADFLRKGHFICLHPLSKCHFYPFLMNFFFKTQGTRLSAIVAPRIGPM